MYAGTLRTGSDPLPALSVRGPPHISGDDGMASIVAGIVVGVIVGVLICLYCCLCASGRADEHADAMCGRGWEGDDAGA